MANTKVTGDLIASLTIATGNIANNAITSDKISGLTTAHITEGANLYYTDARARAAVSVSGNALSYNSSTGVITSNFEESPAFTGNVGIGVAAHGTASLNITNTDQHIRLNNGSELGVISLDTDGKLDLWAHGTDETINFRTGTGSGTVTMSVVGGNVGIGTTSPAAKLHVEGTIKLGGYSYIGEDLSDQDSLTIASDHTEAIHFAHFTPATSTYSTNMIIDNSGNVGIGTSSPTESKLVISGGATGTVGGGDAGITMINKFDNPDNSWSILPVITGVANTGFSIRDNTDSTDRLVINGSGNVGIGVNDPQAKLEVKGTSASPADGNEVISVTNTTGGSKLLLGVAENSYGWIQSVEGSTYRNLLLNPLGGNVGIGTTSPDNKLQVVAGNAQVQAWFGETGYTNAAIRVGGDNGGGGRVYIQYNGDDSYIDSYGGHGSTQRYRDFTVGARNIRFVTGNTSGSEKMRVTESGKTLIGTTSEQNAGTLQVQSGGSENGGTLDIAAGGFYRYYTRVCRNATSVGTAGYWHIKTNIAANSNTMFLAKFYGYIYGSAQILDLQHAGYAYSGTSTVINQGATNNGTDPNASSAVYISANGSKVTFRIAFGSGSNFSTYFAGVFMDMAFPSPAGQGHDFEIEAQSFSTSTTVY